MPLTLLCTSAQMSNQTIVLDADGVLLDYNLAYAGAWKSAFGHRPALRDVNAYWAFDRWQVDRLEGTSLERFRECFHEEFWTSIPAIDGSVEACKTLVSHGCQLVCVTALESRYREARLSNLRTLGFPIDDVFTVEDRGRSESPKVDIIRKINPIAFVDDYLPYHRGVPAQVHKALILREPVGSPNAGAELLIVNSMHQDLRAFADVWTA